MNDRIYVCHTYYHVYITVLKELNLPKEERGRATLVLSTMSNDFGTLKERAEASGLFEAVHMFDERRDDQLPQVMAYHNDRGNILLNMLQRIRYTRELGKAQEANVPVDFRDYKDIYVFCDSDPIGYYLNYKHIRYHAVEDGLDTIVYCDDARFGNRGCFALKALLAKTGLIFIENGYSRYCQDMEVNNIAAIRYKLKNFKEVPRKALADNVAKEDWGRITDLFMEDPEAVMKQLKEVPPEKKKVMILSCPVCDLETRGRMMRDIIDQYAKDAAVFIKQHPRDTLDYHGEDFSDCIVIRGRFPMEMMDYFEEMHVDTVISILTVLDNVTFADEKIKLGNDFLDRYEDPLLHRQNEQI